MKIKELRHELASKVIVKLIDAIRELKEQNCENSGTIWYIDLMNMIKECNATDN